MKNNIDKLFLAIENKIDMSAWGRLKEFGYVAISWLLAKSMEAFELTGVSHKVVVGLAFLLIFDTISGWYQCKVLSKAGIEKYNKPTSVKLKEGVIAKMFLLFVPVVLSVVLNLVSNVDVSYIFTVFLAILAINEGYSSIGNIYSILYKEEVEEYDAISLLIKGVLSLFKAMAKGILDKLKNKTE